MAEIINFKARKPANELAKQYEGAVGYRVFRYMFCVAKWDGRRYTFLTEDGTFI